MATEQRDPRETEDDGFHEIQLSGKQLVFLCMATTVVSIVIFLCGVLVGRGVRPVEPVAEAASVTSEPVAPLPEAPAPAETPAAEPAPAPKVAAATPAPATPPPPAKTEPAPKTESAPKPEPPKAPPVVAKAAPAPSTTPEPVNESAPPPPAPKPAAAAAAAATGASQGGAIAVQVGALREKGEAEALARRLSGKGYAAYIVAPDAGAANAVYRVRVGNYSSQDEATRVKRRLEQEEKLKPWIIR